MGYELHIVKTDDWAEAQKAPLEKSEIDELIASDEELAWSDLNFVDYQESTGEVVRLFAVLWQGAPNFIWNGYEIMCHNPNEAQMYKMAAMAKKLKANLVGNDGQKYVVKRKLLGGKKLVVE